MLIMGLENPEGNKTYLTAAFPSACGKTNLAMIIPPGWTTFNAGWKTTLVGDDIAWLWPGKSGKLHAINPETGFFGVAPGTSWQSNPGAMHALSKNTIFTNVALDATKVVSGGKASRAPPKHLIDWTGQDWTPRLRIDSPPMPNSRFTAPANQCPNIDPRLARPRWSPHRCNYLRWPTANIRCLWFSKPLTGRMAFSLEPPKAPKPPPPPPVRVGTVRRDPMAMLPFCGYNMGDYFAHWLDMRKHIRRLPRIFHVNWFRKDTQGNFLWPGFRQNIRVLEWIVKRCHGRIPGHETPIGWTPDWEDFCVEGLEGFTHDQFDAAMEFRREDFLAEITSQNQFFLKLYHSMPKELLCQHELLMARMA